MRYYRQSESRIARSGYPDHAETHSFIGLCVGIAIGGGVIAALFTWLVFL